MVSVYYRAPEFTAEERKAENGQVSNRACSFAGATGMYLLYFSPGNNWESNLVLSRCTSERTGLISSS